jgi:hypothetical protein
MKFLADSGATGSRHSGSGVVHLEVQLIECVVVMAIRLPADNRAAILK